MGNKQKRRLIYVTVANSLPKTNNDRSKSDLFWQATAYDMIWQPKYLFIIISVFLQKNLHLNKEYVFHISSASRTCLCNAFFCCCIFDVTNKSVFEN